MLPVIAGVAVDNRSPIGASVVRAQIRTKPGEPLSLKTLEQDLKRIHSIDTFEKADFHLNEKDGKTDLLIETREKSWGPHYLCFGFSLVDDLNGSAGYNLSASLTSTALNRLGAEWQNQIQIGDTPRFFSEFYQPLDESLRYFIAPRVEYKSWNINNYSEGVLLSQYRASAIEAGLARLIYYRLASTGLGEFQMPLYAGFSLEAGNAWATRSDISGRTLIYAGSLLVGAETYLGPLYLAYGQAEGGHHSLYIYLGHKF